MFSDIVSEVVTILTQAVMITVMGWIAVFAWQDIGGVENFKRILFGKRSMRNIQKRSHKPKQNKVNSGAYVIKKEQDIRHFKQTWM